MENANKNTTPSTTTPAKKPATKVVKGDRRTTHSGPCLGYFN